MQQKGVKSVARVLQVIQYGALKEQENKILNIRKTGNYTGGSNTPDEPKGTVVDEVDESSG